MLLVRSRPGDASGQGSTCFGGTCIAVRCGVQGTACRHPSAVTGRLRTVGLICPFSWPLRLTVCTQVASGRPHLSSVRPVHSLPAPEKCLQCHHPLSVPACRAVRRPPSPPSESVCPVVALLPGGRTAPHQAGVADRTKACLSLFVLRKMVLFPVLGGVCINQCKWHRSAELFVCCFVSSVTCGTTLSSVPGTHVPSDPGSVH